MKKPQMVILAIGVMVVVIGAILFFSTAKECKDLDEQQCKQDDSCLSVLIPCTDPTCTSDATFQRCKEKGQ